MSLLFLLPLLAVFLYRKRDLRNVETVPSLEFLEVFKTRHSKQKKLHFPPKLLVDITLLTLLALAAQEFFKEEKLVAEVVIDNSFYTRAVVNGESIFARHIREATNLTGFDYYNIYQTSPFRKVNEQPVGRRSYRDLLKEIRPSYQSAGYVTIGNRENLRLFSSREQGFDNVYIESATKTDNGLQLVLGSSSPQTVTLRAGSNYEDTFTLSGTTTKSIELQDTGKLVINLSAERDAIKEDSTWYYSAESSVVPLITIVSEEDVGDIFLSNYSLRKTNNPDVSNGIAIFYKQENISEIRTPSLFVLPKAGLEEVFSIKQVAREPRLVSWDTSHESLRYLRPELASVKAALTFSSENLDTVITSDKGPLLLAGSVNQKRVAVLGIDLFPFAGGEQAFQSILFLNLVNWLSEQQEASLIYATETLKPGFSGNTPVNVYVSAESDSRSIPQLTIRESEEIKETVSPWWELSLVAAALILLDSLLAGVRRYA